MRAPMPARLAVRTGTGVPAGAVVAALGVVYIVWGSTYYAIRVAIDTMPPLLMAGTRFLVAGALLFAVAALRGDAAGDPIRPRHWRSALILGVALLGIGNGGVTVGEQYIPSGIAALLVATVPLWMAVFAHIVGVERVRPVTVAGIAVGLLGVGLLLRPGAGGGASIVAMLAMLVAPLCWAGGSVYSRFAPLPRRPLVATAMEMLCGGAALVLAGIVRGEIGQVHLDAVSLRSVLAFLYLVLFGSLLAFTAYIWLLNKASTSLVSTYAYANPLVAVLLGWWLLGERITGQTLLAAAVIVIAVALIVSSRSRGGGAVATVAAGGAAGGEGEVRECPGRAQEWPVPVGSAGGAGVDA